MSDILSVENYNFLFNLIVEYSPKNYPGNIIPIFWFKDYKKVD